MVHYESGGEEPGPAAPGLAEAQIAAIEGAFAEHDRILTRLRRELAELREQPAAESEGETAPDLLEERLEERLSAIEARLEQQDQALRHVLQRLIAFFEREGPKDD